MSQPSFSAASPAGHGRSPMRWVPSLYFVQGMQFFVVMALASFMLKNMGVDNDQIARWTSALGTAWAIKPLWSPFLELVNSKKLIVVVMQAVGAMALVLMAVVLQTPWWFGGALCVFFLIAYSSATHDIACDGLYMGSLDHQRQARYAGWQGAFFNGARFFMVGVVLKIAGLLETPLGVFNAWTAVFVGLAVLLAGLASYNAVSLPGQLSAGHTDLRAAAIWANTRDIVADFGRKPGIRLAILFIVLFRFAEGQVQTIGPLFLIEARDKGGLGLTTSQVADIYGWVGTVAFLAGSVLGGYFTAWLTLRRAMPVLIVAMAIPNATFYYLAATLPQDMWHIGGAVLLEMFGYGFGFVGMILYIMQAVAPGRFQTAHYALGSGVMQLGFILSRSISGDIQLAIGYERFFQWTILCGIPVLLMLPFVRMSAADDQPKNGDDAPTNTNSDTSTSSSTTTAGTVA
ncbi:MFS transporter, PAT family, beta-lactamase induction signal transducer AmpG [Roseateles sp. YR242]|uniref:AmpG family muropeptide MFS transporter n=1 Tax=Roseateles sp. YR242 TaxID=1855305 RepID=UPI0008B4C563|nr:AmpG family muropeptide MFS transporter [Roseateles sp. YR242]SEL51699.1 MFS transporter, PAT family, beta-lactamase induction signal transducer AmpG [Roseateles sp. YR242]